MTRQKNWDFYQEYAEMQQAEYDTRHETTPEKLQENLETERAKRKEQEEGRRSIVNPVQDWNQNLAAIAEARCKSRAEYKQEEVDELIQSSAFGAMKPKDAYQLEERYKSKIQSKYRAGELYRTQIAECDQRIAKLESASRQKTQRKQKSVQNKLNHWRERKVDMETRLSKIERKERRYEPKCMKWMGIHGKIKTAEIGREIALEKTGRTDDNKYGFNPRGRDRETAEIVFTD